MQVVITKAQLEAVKACPAYLDSPEWDGEQLVYADWDETVQRLFSTSFGTAYLGFLVSRNLVPMTREQFRAVREARRRG